MREMVRNKNMEDINVLRITLESTIDELERHFESAHLNYLQNTDQRTQDFKFLTRNDQELSKDIETKLRQIDRLQSSITHWRTKTSQNMQECNERNKLLREEKEAINKHFQQLKSRMNRFRDGQSPMELFQDFVSHSAEVTTLALAKSDRILLTGSLDCKVILYDRVNTRRVTDWDFGGAVMQLHVDAHDKHVYVGGTDYTMKAYELTGERRHVLDLVGHSGKVISMAISKNNVLCSGAHDFKILLWKLKAEYKLGDMGKPNSMFPILTKSLLFYLQR